LKSKAPKQYIWQEHRLETLTKGILIVFEHLQEKACTPLKKFGLVSQQLSLRVAHPSPIAHQHYNSENYYVLHVQCPPMQINAMLSVTYFIWHQIMMLGKNYKLPKVYVQYSPLESTIIIVGTFHFGYK